MAAPLATTLREAAGSGLLIGAAVGTDHLADPAVAALVARQFSALTAENEFKPLALQPQPGRFDFARADALADFAARHGQQLVGHTLVWHNQAPRWLFADADGRPLPRALALANLRAHVETVVRHFRGRVIGWDVVNEAVADAGADRLRATPALAAIGEDYVEEAFASAQAADPAAELYYNDYGNEEPAKLERCLDLARRLRRRGIRIDAIGLQGHWSLGHPDATTLDAALAAIAREGLGAMVTELDIDVAPWSDEAVARARAAAEAPGPEEPSDEFTQALARRYAEIVRVLRQHAGTLTRITFWGTHDGMSWLNAWPIRRTSHPLLWDRRLGPKAALTAVLEALAKR